MPFRNRAHAAQLLAQRLSAYRGKNPLVLGIPRGAVPMAKIIAAALDGEVDVVLVHKLGAPGHPELAIGSVDETGHLYLGDHVRGLGVSEAYIAAEKAAQLETLSKRRALYTPVRPPINPAGRIVIVVDNGVATGATLIAALRAVRAKQPARLTAAAAVVAPDTLKQIAEEADFSQVSDAEVIEILRQSSPQPARAE